MKRLHDILKQRWGTLRGFRQGKRRELRAVNKALHELRMGCAFLPRPAYRRLCNMLEDGERLKQELSCKEWGR